MLTRSSSEKNEQFLKELWAQYDVLSKNIARLRIDLANQAPGALRLQLERDIERAKEDRDKVLRELEDLEQAIKNQAELQAEQQEEYRRKYLDTFIRNLREDPDLKVPYIEPYFATQPKNRVMQKLPPDERSLSVDSLEEETGEGDLAFNEVLREVLYDREQRNWVITGDAGMGKTTLLKKIGLLYAREAQLDKTRPLPVFILLAEFAQDFQQQTQMKETLSSLSAHIAAKLRDSFREITAREVEDNIIEGRYHLLLDALDEIGKPNLELSVIKSLNDTLRRSACRVIITSRIANYQYDSPLPFTTSRVLCRFNREQIEAYIQQQFGGKLTKQAASLRDSLDDPHLRSLLSRPLLLYLIVNRVRDLPEDRKFDIPNNRVLLYKSFVDGLIEKRARKQKEFDSRHRLPGDSDKQREYLSKIAYELHSIGRRYAPKRMVEECIRSVSPGLSSKDIDEHIRYLIQEADVLQQRYLIEISVDHYTFSYLTFQEFFTAEYLLEHGTEEMRDQLLEDSMNPWWREVIVIYNTLNTFGPDDWLPRTLMEERENIFATGILLAVECLKVSLKEKPLLYQSMYKQLEERYYQSPYPPLKERLFEGMLRLGGPLLLEFLAKELDDSEHRVRAINALGQIGMDEGETDQRRPPKARSQMASDEAKAVRLLSRQYENSDQNLRLIIIEALIRLNTEISPRIILKWLNENSQHSSRIVYAMINTHRKDYVKTLFDLVDQRETPAQVRETVLQQLGKGELPLVKDQFQERLQRAIKQNDVLRMAELLGAIHFPVDELLRNDIQSLLGLEEARNVRLLRAIICFLGQQATYSANQEPDATMLEILFYNSIIENNKEVSLDLSSQEKEALHADILSTLIKINNQDAFDYITEYITEHMEERSSRFIWKQMLTTASRFGGEASFVYVAKQLEAMKDKSSYPATKALIVQMIQCLYQIGLRLIHERKTLQLSPKLCGQLLQNLEATATEEISLAEATIFLLFHCADDRQIISLLKLARRRTQIGEAVARYLENALHGRLVGKDDCVLGYHLPEQLQMEVWSFVEHYGNNRPSSWLAYQLRMGFLASQDDRRTNLLKDLQSSEPSVCSHALDMALSFFDADDDELMEVSRSLLDHSDYLVVEKAITLLGKFGRKEAIADLLPFLNKPQYKRKAFEALFDLAQRHRLLGDKIFREQQHAINI